MAKIILLKAEKGSGKTTALIRLLEKLTILSVCARGVVSPPVEEDGIKIAINLMDVSSGEEKRLAVPKKDENIEPAGLHWRFEPGTLAWGNRLLADAVPCDILFVDEMGPLEFNRSEGLMKGFEAINSRRYLVALVTIRPSLLESAMSHWPDAEVYEVTRKNQSRLVSDLFRQITK
jgi:nucleoside-triphosphatase THEP1